MTAVPVSDEVKNLIETYEARRKIGDELISDLKAMEAEIDPYRAHIEFIVGQFVELGVITIEQMWTMMVKWETHLNKQMIEMKRSVVAARAEQRRLAVEAASRKSLIVPPHIKRAQELEEKRNAKAQPTDGAEASDV